MNWLYTFANERFRSTKKASDREDLGRVLAVARRLMKRIQSEGVRCDLVSNGTGLFDVEQQAVH